MITKVNPYGHISLTNDYFWNGWGDGNYSKYTLRNAGNPDHPRLTYNKVNNNYKTSTFWLEDGGFFKIQTVELGYELPVHRLGITSIRRMRVYLRGNNLCTVSKIKDVDPEAIGSGAPQPRAHRLRTHELSADAHLRGRR